MIGPLQRSLKTRVTLFSLLIFVLSLWALAYYASKMLRTDLEQLLSDQQLSTVALVAANINQELNDRMTALEKIAVDFNEKELKSPATLQGILERRPILPLLFNAGYYVTDAAGTTTASFPVETGRIGINFMFRKHVAVALGEGKSAVSVVDIGKALGVPVFSLAVPIRNAQGKVIGSLVGVINLSSDNFLDRIISNPYGRTGGYVLVARQQRMIVTGTDKSRVMEVLPPIGVSPDIDKFLAGREGSAILRNPKGVEVLVSAKGIPVADWYVAATLPTAEAFAPIHDMQQRMLLATILLTLIAGGLTWWMLRRQLAPIGAAAAALGARPGQGLVPEPLPVTRQDEIGQLISSFNSLLNALRRIVKDLGETQRIAHIGSWHLDLATNQVVWSEELYKMYGFDPSLPVPPYTEHMKLFTPESWERLSATLAHTREAGVPYTLELETVRKDGNTGWMWVQGEVEVDSAGKTVGLWGAAQDITERKRAEAEVRESNDRLAAVMDNITEGLIMANHQGQVIYWNPTALAMHGFASMDECRRPLAEFTELIEILPVNEDRVLSIEEWPMSRVLRGERLHDWENRLRRTDQGWEKIFAYSGWLIHSTSGERLAFLSVNDITERKRAEGELRKSEERYRVITDHSPAGIFQTDAQGDCTYVNPRWTGITGLTLDEALGQGWSQALHPEDKQRVFDVWYAAAIAGLPCDWECRFVTKLGKQSWITGHAEVLYDQQGNRQGYLGVIVDITARKQAEEDIRLAEARFQAIIEASPIPFALNDSEQNITYLNSAFIQTFGYDQKDIPTVEAWWPKAYPDEMYRQELVKEWWLRLDVAKRDAKPFEPMEVRIRCKDGGERTVLATVTPLASSLNDLHVVTLYDITERKKTESLLHEQLDELHRWHQTMLGREGRIISMKQEVNELLARSGQPPRYADHLSADRVSGVGQTPAESGGGDA